ncbi:hypothetical protein QBC33DRAFT_461849 [Phialemonium atrogriseum]|uniref:Uncharacterized protein n=1 Tax=Phialemonium atrogriseum TaxID=1093897 RepID=A0AAJ0BPT9_9PEZI|nr:uncharacterized protein QBC33DRAFT_461849 [Phialemonium atrogriseum]KAK1762264.1 hypothetical protein QBC33DRAFT_461849 [Phialemonium atrogriseum]
MSPETGVQGQRTAPTPAGNGISEPGKAAPAKRTFDEDVQFISSNPVKKRRASGQGPEHPINNVQPVQPPCSSVQANVAATCQAPSTDRSISTGMTGLSSYPTAEGAYDNRGASVPALENFAFPKSFPPTYVRPPRVSEAVSPKQLPETLAPHLLAAGGCQTAPMPPLPTVALDQISCLDVKGPSNHAAMDMASFNPSVVQPLAQSGYMQLNPHTAMPFAMYSMGNLASAGPPPRTDGAMQINNSRDPKAAPTPEASKSPPVQAPIAHGPQQMAPHKPPYMHNTPPPSRSPTPGIASGVATYVMSPQGHPHPALIGRPPANHPVCHPSSMCPKPNVIPPMPPTSNPPTSRSGTPVPPTSSASPPAATTTAAAAAEPPLAKQPTPAAATPPPPASPTALARRKHAQNLLVDVAETVGEIFPFEEVARRHGVLPRKVVEALAAVVQVPLLRCATDKRRAGKLGGERMREYREARKMWMARKAEAGRAGRAAAAGEGGSRGRDDDVVAVGAGAGAAERKAQGKDRKEAGVPAPAPAALQLADMLPPTELPSPLATETFTGPW